MERGLKLLREGAPVFDPEELSEVAVADPIVAEEREPARLHAFDSFVERFEARPDYFVRVRGDSLDRAGFRTGDIVAVRRQPEANDGDLVVARIGQEITLKRLRRIDDECLELEPESTNPKHRSIRIDAQTEDIEIVGVIVGAVVGVPRTPRLSAPLCEMATAYRPTRVLDRDVRLILGHIPQMVILNLMGDHEFRNA